nr:heat shock protein 20 [Monochamus alternatus]
MSIIPWLDDIFVPRPSRRRQLCVSRDPEEYLEAYLPREILRYPLEELANLRNLLQTTDTGVSVNSDKNKFQVNVDVQQFNPEEISVKVTGDNTITIEAKHEEKPDEHGYISRHFVRKYVLPENCDIKYVQSKLSSDGVLTITAPTINEEKKIEYREIPVIKTGQPIKSVEQKDTQQEIKE